VLFNNVCLKLIIGGKRRTVLTLRTLKHHNSIFVLEVYMVRKNNVLIRIINYNKIILNEICIKVDCIEFVLIRRLTYIFSILSVMCTNNFFEINHHQKRKTNSFIIKKNKLITSQVFKRLTFKLMPVGRYIL